MKNKTVILITFLCFTWHNIFAQIEDLNQEIPADPSVKIGKLSNGLTYYIKHNAKPANKAELRLVLKAGSILEDEDQLGLAHFIEHMAFNGTKSFPKNELIDYLQSLGIEFGADLNAHTGFDETVYKLSVPTDASTLNTSLQVLRDWADGITFSHEEIDNERGVVAEELRARSGARMRMYYKSIPVLTNNSRYAERLPIGTLDVIMNSEYDVMKRFYNDWYRPDLMALVLVGDFDVNQTEEKVKDIFESIKPHEASKERVYYKIPNNENTKITVITDKEARGIQFTVYIKREEEAIKTLKDYRQQVLNALYSGMLRQRFDELTTKPDPPFLSATAGIGNFLANMDCYYLRVNLNEDKVNDGISALLIESERARKFGFTEGELLRYKASMLNRADMLKKEKGKLSTRFYIEQYIDNFTDNDPIPGEAFNYEFYKSVLPTITLDEVNSVAKKWVRDDNIAIVLNAVEKSSFTPPTEDEISQILEDVATKNISPYKDELANAKLMDELPISGKIINELYNEKMDVTTWELQNGITVIAKPTQFQNDLISMSGFRPGGSSVVPDSLYISARNAGTIVSRSGVNGISPTDLKKINMGKTLNVTPRINFYDDLFSGISSNKDFEDLFQMTHLYFTSPNKDENIFNSFKENMKSIAKDQDKTPGIYFDNRISDIMTKNHLRATELSEEDIEKNLNLDDAFNFYKERFSFANGFTFVFVGSFQIDQLKDYVSQYLGSLPSDLNKKSNWKDIGLRYTHGIIKDTTIKGVDDKSKVDMRFVGQLKFSLEEKKKISLLGKLLKIKLTEELREKMAGVYGTQVSGFAADRPYDWYRLNIRFTCDPDNVNKLITKVLEEIDKIKRNGASDTDVNKIKEAELTNAKDALEYNQYWIYKLKESYMHGLNFESILDYEESINKIDSNMFKEAANTYFNMNNYAEFILMPEQLDE